MTCCFPDDLSATSAAKLGRLGQGLLKGIQVSCFRMQVAQTGGQSGTVLSCEMELISLALLDTFINFPLLSREIKIFMRREITRNVDFHMESNFFIFIKGLELQMLHRRDTKEVIK